MHESTPHLLSLGPTPEARTSANSFEMQHQTSLTRWDLAQAHISAAVSFISSGVGRQIGSPQAKAHPFDFK